jgi:hypothetical protein
MTYSREEIKELRERVEKAEDDILYIAREIAAFVCTMAYNVGLSFIGLSPAERNKRAEAYGEFMGKRLDAISEKIVASQTIEEAFNIARAFHAEIWDYIKAEKVKTATEAMDIAHSFIKKYIPVALPMKAVREGDVWNVDVDVGALAVKIAKVKVDTKTGDILSYEIPER